jgi:hypothetical protein
MLDKFVSIIWAVISNPYKYFSEDMPKDDSLKYPLIFAVAVSTVPIIIQSVSFLPNFWSAQGLTGVFSTAFFVSFCIFVPIVKIIYIYMLAFFAHAEIFLFVPQRTGFKQTLKVLSYTSAANVFLVIPFIGAAVSFVFEIRALIFGLSAVHNVSALKIFMLFLIIPIIIVLALFVSVFVFASGFLKDYTVA